jgi:hypothetical protein
VLIYISLFASMQLYEKKWFKLKFSSKSCRNCVFFLSYLHREQVDNKTVTSSYWIISSIISLMHYPFYYLFACQRRTRVSIADAERNNNIIILSFCVSHASLPLLASTHPNCNPPFIWHQLTYTAHACL